MTDSDYAAKAREQRQNLEDFARVLDDLVARGDDVGPFVPSRDAASWRDLDRIEAAGHERDAAQAAWLAGLTQVDDLGPNGRAMFLAQAALDALGRMPGAALRRMPEVALAEGKALLGGLAPGASIYRKVGVCLVLEASASAAAAPLIEGFTRDDRPYVRREAGWCLERLRERTGRRGEE